MKPGAVQPLPFFLLSFSLLRAVGVSTAAGGGGGGEKESGYRSASFLAPPGPARELLVFVTVLAALSCQPSLSAYWLGAKVGGGLLILSLSQHVAFKGICELTKTTTKRNPALESGYICLMT